LPEDPGALKRAAAQQDYAAARLLSYPITIIETCTSVTPFTSLRHVSDCYVAKDDGWQVCMAQGAREMSDAISPRGQ